MQRGTKYNRSEANSSPIAEPSVGAVSLKRNNKMDELKNLSKDEILDKIEELQQDWINEGIAQVQEKVGMNHGDCSLELDLEFREVFKSLAKCTYNQLKENGYVK